MNNQTAFLFAIALADDYLHHPVSFLPRPKMNDGLDRYRQAAKELGFVSVTNNKGTTWVLASSLPDGDVWYSDAELPFVDFISKKANERIPKQQPAHQLRGPSPTGSFVP